MIYVSLPGYVTDDGVVYCGDCARGIAQARGTFLRTLLETDFFDRDWDTHSVGTRCDGCRGRFVEEDSPRLLADEFAGSSDTWEDATYRAGYSYACGQFD